MKKNNRVEKKDGISRNAIGNIHQELTLIHQKLDDLNQAVSQLDEIKMLLERKKGRRKGLLTFSRGGENTQTKQVPVNTDPFSALLKNLPQSQNLDMTAILKIMNDPLIKGLIQSLKK